MPPLSLLKRRGGGRSNDALGSTLSVTNKICYVFGFALFLAVLSMSRSMGAIETNNADRNQPSETVRSNFRQKNGVRDDGGGHMVSSIASLAVDVDGNEVVVGINSIPKKDNSISIPEKDDRASQEDNIISVIKKDDEIDTKKDDNSSLSKKEERTSQEKTHKREPIPEVGTVLFNPQKFVSPDTRHEYINLPIACQDCDDQLDAALKLSIGEPYGLKHKANPPGHDAVMGLAAYPRNMATFRRLVGSLRATGYDGHIILGVHSQIPASEEEYLQFMDVTYYLVEFIDCDDSIQTEASGGGAVRSKCSKGLENLKLEWGRFEMCRQWLHACKECTGWNLVMDTRDLFFQRHPFASLEDAAVVEASADNEKADLLFIEELAPHTDPFYSDPKNPKRHFTVNNNSRYTGHTNQCYGRDHSKAFGLNRPVLCSGTIVGTRTGINRFLSVLVYEFHANNQKPNKQCRSPDTTDQWTMNYLYYSGRFGKISKTETLPWGTGPVNTVGKPCIDNRQKPNHSAKDIVQFDSETGLILNNYETEDSLARIAPVVHQYDRCIAWALKMLHEAEFFKTVNYRVEDLDPLPWKT